MVPHTFPMQTNQNTYQFRWFRSRALLARLAPVPVPRAGMIRKNWRHHPLLPIVKLNLGMITEGWLPTCGWITEGRRGVSFRLS
jgi:hypothetical protein